MVSSGGNSELQPRDVLLIDMSADEMDFRQFCSDHQLKPMVLRGEYFPVRRAR